MASGPFDDVKTLVAGASRVVIGSLAVSDIETTKRIFEVYGSEKEFAFADVLAQMKGFISRFQDGRNSATLIYLPLSKPTLRVVYACGYVLILIGTEFLWM